MGCVQNAAYGTVWDIQGYPYYDTVTGLPCNINGNSYPDIAPNITPYPIKINTNTGGAGGITGGQTTLDKLLATLTSIYALNQRAPYVPTTAQPAQQSYYGGGQFDNNAALLALAQGRNSGTGASLGASIESLIQNNKGILLIGGIMVVLLFVKPPTRRNGLKRKR